MIAGSDGLAIIPFHNPKVAQFIGMVVLSIILFSGGLDTKYSDIKPIAAPGAVLATVGVVLTTLLTGFFIYGLTHYFFDEFSLSLFESLLLAAVMSSTDSASVFAILRSKGLKLKHNLRPLLEFESGSNDPMAYMLMIMFMQFVQAEYSNVGNLIGAFFYQFAIGALAGYILGKLSIRILNRINLDYHSLYPILLLAFSLIIFSLTHALKGNGFLAVYIGGLVIGNARFMNKRTSKNFFDGFAWLAQIIMFLTLGLLVNPSELLPIAILGFIIGFFMIIFARPITVFACLLPFRKISLKANLYTSWVGLRGAVPIIFATYLLTAQIPHANIMFNVVFFITIISLLIQGTSVPIVAKLLGVGEQVDTHKHSHAFDIEFSEEIKSAMAEIPIRKEYLRNGNHLVDLPIPENTLVTMVKRDHHYFIPQGNVEIYPGDVLLVISDDEKALKETFETLGIKKYSLRKH
jgi:cell volume regulation protein A